MNKPTRLSLFSALFAILIAALFAACGSVSGSGNASAANPTSSTSNGIPKQTVTSTAGLKSANGAAGSVPLKVTGVDISLSLPTIKNLTCGTNVTETYTALFHFPVNNAGGLVNFEYTSNSGRASRPASLSVRPGQTSATYAFSWSGSLDPANTTPGQGGVMVTSPNAYTSNRMAPIGPCIPASSGSFMVNSVSLVAGPEVTGHRCGTSFTETYTATFYIAGGGPGGTLVFQYTTTNGRSSSNNVSLKVAAGQTTATYVFKWSGNLPQSHTAPGIGAVMVSAPNQIISQSATPPGACSNM